MTLVDGVPGNHNHLRIGKIKQNYNCFLFPEYDRADPHDLYQY